MTTLIGMGFQSSTYLTSLSSDSAPESGEYEFYDVKTSATEEWVKSFGSDVLEEGNDVAVDSGGNVYVVGHINQDNSTLVKYSSSGVYQWNKTQKTPNLRLYSSIFIDDFDNLYVAGFFINGTKFDTLLVKYDTGGNEIWNKTWGGGSGNDQALDVAVDSNGNIYVAGVTESFEAKGMDFLLIKYDNTGHKEWNKTWGLSNDLDWAYSLCIDSQGNVFVGGLVNKTIFPSFSSYDFALTCWNGSNGNLLWNTTWGSWKQEYFYDMTIDSQDFIYMVGESTSLSSDDFCIVKYDNAGIPVWSKIWGSDYNDGGKAVGIDSNDNVYFVGETEGYGAGLWDLYISKFNSDGVQQWYTLWGHGNQDFANALYIDQSSHDFYITGRSQSFSLGINHDIFLLKNPSFPTSSNTIYNYYYNTVEEDDDDDEDDDSNLLLTVGIVSAISIVGVVALISAILINKRLKGGR